PGEPSMSECGAVPKYLIDYADWGLAADRQLAQQAGALGKALDAFRASAPDPKYIGSIPHLDLQVAAYAQLAAGVDDWVGRVGEAFKQAGEAEVALAARHGISFDPLATLVVASSAQITALARGEEAALQADLATIAAGARSAARTFLALQRAGTDPGLAAEVRAWWGTLDPHTQQQLITSDPALIGWLDGLPA